MLRDSAEFYWVACCIVTGTCPPSHNDLKKTDIANLSCSTCSHWMERGENFTDAKGDDRFQGRRVAYLPLFPRRHCSENNLGFSCVLLPSDARANLEGIENYPDHGAGTQNILLFSPLRSFCEHVRPFFARTLSFCGPSHPLLFSGYPFLSPLPLLYHPVSMFCFLSLFVAAADCISHRRRKSVAPFPSPPLEAYHLGVLPQRGIPKSVGRRERPARQLPCGVRRARASHGKPETTGLGQGTLNFIFRLRSSVARTLLQAPLPEGPLSHFAMLSTQAFRQPFDFTSGAAITTLSPCADASCRIVQRLRAGQ
jgi:hypothetical protein